MAGVFNLSCLFMIINLFFPFKCSYQKSNKPLYEKNSGRNYCDNWFAHGGILQAKYYNYVFH